MPVPKTLQEAIQLYSNEQTCITAVADMRWPNGVKCPHCSAKKPYWIASQKRWKCRDCRKQFSVKVGTIFEDSPIPLQKWLPALWMLVSCKNGISSHELARGLGITQKSAWFVLHRLRTVLEDPIKAKLGGPDNEIELDETYIGGRTINMHKDRKLRLERERSKYPAWKNPLRFPGKTPVFGMLDRDLRKVRAAVVPNVKRETLQERILNEVERGSKVYTDQAVAYDNLAENYTHEVVNHVETYVRGRVHTNGLENFWSLLKRGLRGTYVAVESFHLDKYVDEQVFRYNNRATKDNPLNDADRFVLALSQVANKRLTYKELTGKDEARPA
jgi:transposase-like protein